jgi:hypothetical protein
LEWGSCFGWESLVWVVVSLEDSWWGFSWFDEEKELLFPFLLCGVQD